MELPKQTKDKLPFKVPGGYFDQQKENFLEKIIEEQKLSESTENIRRAKRRNIVWVLSAAAAVAFILLIWKTPSEDPNHSGSFLADITPQEALEYVLANGDDFYPMIEDDAVWQQEIITNESILQDHDIDDQILIDEVIDGIDIYDIQEL